VGHARREDAAHGAHLIHRVGRGFRRDDEAGPLVQPQGARPALAVDTADDGKLLDEEAVLVVQVHGVEERELLHDGYPVKWEVDALPGGRRAIPRSASISSMTRREVPNLAATWARDSFWSR